MRDVLINILQEIDSPGDPVSPIDAVDAILKHLRCDNCKHWRKDPRDNDGQCFKLQESKQCLAWGYEYEDYQVTKPDFFCALFEPRA